VDRMESLVLAHALSTERLFSARSHLSLVQLLVAASEVRFSVQEKEECLDLEAEGPICSPWSSRTICKRAVP